MGILINDNHDQTEQIEAEDDEIENYFNKNIEALYKDDVSSENELGYDSNYGSEVEIEDSANGLSQKVRIKSGMNFRCRMSNTRWPAFSSDNINILAEIKEVNEQMASSKPSRIK